jgi:hypothetical protein
MNLQELRKKADRLNLEYLHARETVKEENRLFVDAQEKVRDLVEAQQVIQTVAQGVQEQAHARISGVVTRCLQAVFGPMCEFRILFERKRGKTEARIVFMEDGHELPPKEAAGGGMVDVAAFALRLVSMSLTKPRLRKVLVLDEPFRFVHGAGNRERVAELVETMSEEYGVQVVMSTGFDWLKIGNVMEL